MLIVLQGTCTGAIAYRLRPHLPDILSIKEVFFGNTYDLLDIVSVPDINMNGSYELAELAVRPDTGAIRIQIKDALTGTVVRNMFQGTSGRAVGLAVLPDTNSNGAVDIAFLLEQEDGISRITILDSLIGVATRLTLMALAGSTTGSPTQSRGKARANTNPE